MAFDMSSMGSFSLISQGAGMLSSAIGSYYSGEAQASSLKYQAALAGINARMSELSAQSALDQGNKEIASMTMRAGQVKGAQRASLAANGVDLGTGSAAEVQTSTELIKEIDKNTIAANAVRSAWGYRTQATNYQNDAASKTAAASSVSGFGSAVASMISGAGQVAGSWYSLNKAGALKGTVFEL